MSQSRRTLGSAIPSPMELSQMAPVSEWWQSQANGSPSDRLSDLAQLTQRRRST